MMSDRKPEWHETFGAYLELSRGPRSEWWESLTMAEQMHWAEKHAAHMAETRRSQGVFIGIVVALSIALTVMSILLGG
jgi:hypothetical protein